MNHKLFFSALLFSLSLPLYAIDLSGQITNQVSRTVNSGIAKNLFDNLIIPELKVRNASGKIKQMQLTADKRFLSFMLADGTARVWDLELGIQRPMISVPQISDLSVAAPQQMAVVVNGAMLESYDVLTANRSSSLDAKIGVIKAMQVSKDGNLVAVASDKQLSLWNLQTQKMLWQQTDVPNSIDALTFDENNRYLAVMSGNAVEIREIKTGKTLQNLSNQGDKVIFSQFTNDTLEVGYHNGEVIVWNLQTLPAVSSRKLDTALLAMDKANNIYAYVLENGKVLVTDAQGNKLASIGKENSTMEAVALMAGGQKLMTVTDAGQLFLWNIKDGKELLQLISTKQGWTVLDSSGRFDSSEQGMPNVSWQAGNTDIPFDNITTNYYEPGLLASALKDESYLIAQPSVILEGVTLPPTLNVTVKEVKKTGDEAELTVDIYDQGGGIDKVDLFHNAKAVNTQRSVTNQTKTVEQDKEHRTMILKVKPTPGTNQIKVVASNKMGIEGSSTEASFNTNLMGKKPSLRLATIGINTYKDKQLNLDYSVADAESIDKLLNEKNLVKFASISSKRLYNKEASKLSILSVLRELSQGAQEDVLAIYFAGHGISINGEWYFLPYETTLQSDLSYFTTVGISATELSDIFKDSSIQHILLMVDACYSGASLDSFRKLQNSQRRFSRMMSRSVGITVVTATRKDQQAAELSELGHGLFTYVLAKGMRGDADVKPKNNQISAHEIADFSTQTIPGYARKYLGAAQEPNSFTMGHDFVLFDNK